MCFVGKMYAVPKTVKVSSVQKRPSFRHIFIPKFVNKKQESKKLKNIILKMEEDSIISRPPIATTQTHYTSNDIIHSKLSEARKTTLKAINEKDTTIAASYTKLIKRNQDKHKEISQNSIIGDDLSSNFALQKSGQLAAENTNKECQNEQIESTTNAGLSKMDSITYEKEGNTCIKEKRKTMSSITRNQKTHSNSTSHEGKVSVPADNVNKNFDMVKAKVKLKPDFNKNIESRYKAFFRKSIENPIRPNNTDGNVPKPAAELEKPIEKVKIRKMQTLKKLNSKRKEQGIKQT